MIAAAVSSITLMVGVTGAGSCSNTGADGNYLGIGVKGTDRSIAFAMTTDTSPLSLPG